MIKSQQKKKQCKYFPLGKCNYGEKCNNIHSKPTTEATKPILTRKQQYIGGILTGAKIRCFGCGKEEHPVYMGCGCYDLCIGCALENRECRRGHKCNGMFIE